MSGCQYHFWGGQLCGKDAETYCPEHKCQECDRPRVHRSKYCGACQPPGGCAFGHDPDAWAKDGSGICLDCRADWGR